ncbi:MAG: response regulator, partial [Rhodospirillales bacterium]|nr:response regulator [Rhodospirillales bacterium]
LILMDINLPGMNGYEALMLLKASPETRHIPVIALTARATESDIEKGKRAGYFEYLTKPIDIAKTLETIRSAIEIS